MTENPIATHIVDCCFRVYERMGPGLLESVYEATLAYELGKRGLSVVSQHGVPVVYDEVRLDLGFRVDLLVEHKVIVEIKSVEALADVHYKQVLTYLKLVDLRLGILVNFNAPILKNEIRRVINGQVS